MQQELVRLLLAIAAKYPRNHQLLEEWDDYSCARRTSCQAIPAYTFPTRAVVLGAGIASIRCRVHMECHLLASRVPGVSSGWFRTWWPMVKTKAISKFSLGFWMGIWWLVYIWHFMESIWFPQAPWFFFLGEVVGLGGRHTFLEVAIVFLCQLVLW